jgi:hypothetical protein
LTRRVVGPARCGLFGLPVRLHLGVQEACVEPAGDAATRWWPWLGTAKAAGAAGLLIGLLVPVIGVIPGIGLALYFAGAAITVVRARWYSHIPYPLLYLVPVVGSLALRFARIRTRPIRAECEISSKQALMSPSTIHSYERVVK